MVKRVAEATSPESIATRGLAYLASDLDRLGRFLALSGLDPKTIRQAAQDPHFLPAVLDHLLGDERLLLDFAATEAIAPEAVAEARLRLGGPAPADA
jgi:uncharacterized protein DUF3572